MTIEKLTEFAKTGNKNTDDLDLETGFIPSRKPARQWFNWLFNTLTLKINEIIDGKIDSSSIVDNLITDDATKPVSAKMGKKLQDEKFAIVNLVNDLTTGGIDKALTAEMGRALNDQAFGIGQDWVDVTAIRVKSTNYLNSSPKPIVFFVYSAGPYSVAIYVNDVLASASFTNDSASNNGASAIVPPGAQYRFETTSTNITNISELK